MKGLLTFLLLVLVLVFAIVMGSRNQDVITINYLIAQSEMRESTLMAITLGAGVVIGMLTMFFNWLKLSWQVSSLKSQVKRLQKED
ncbi:LapA family protein [Alteromonas sp. LMIT006]|uniref:LapA family protein n=1 Tax=Alteromonadaceae TaxID=72275 RepID=UPI0020CA8642|nr:LapA family protein [Alteromonas sp. LMIT006]UTP72044.1 LapA family protein [Alteromonas sp. LMIT006]